MTVLMGVDARLQMARLLLTLPALPPDQAGPLAQRVFSAGVNVIGVRDPGTERAAVRATLDQVRAVSYDYQGLVMVHDDLELAAEFQADVLHLGQAAGSAAQARGALHQWARIGRSCHTPEQVDAAIADPEVNYFFVGPVWSSQPDPPYPAPGVSLVQHAAEVAPPGDRQAKPWFAVGGITEPRVEEVIDAGARRLGVVGAITTADDPAHAAAALEQRMRRAWAEDPALGELPGTWSATASLRSTPGEQPPA